MTTARADRPCPGACYACGTPIDVMADLCAGCADNQRAAFDLMRAEKRWRACWTSWAAERGEGR